MHSSAYETGRKFFELYTKNKENLKVLEVGSQNVNGTLRDHITPNISEYVGIDFEKGNGVDIVINDAYQYPFPDNHFDICVSSSSFEHTEMFWLVWLEAMRVLKPNGILYVNAPSAWMVYHRYPVDCWRFYPDSAKALETWGRYNKLNTLTLETFICPPAHNEDVADWVGIFLKHFNYQDQYPDRIIDNLVPYEGYFNGFRFPATNKFPDGWKQASAWYHMATKKNLVHPYQGFKY